MSNHSSATGREHTPHAKQLSRTNTIVNALKLRAQAILDDESIDAQSRAIIRYALEINDPWLARLIRRVDSGESIGDNLDLDSTETENDDCDKERLEALTEFICRAGDEPETKSAALLVLMGTIENSAHPKAVANTVKHLAFTHCGELNLFGMVEAQIAVAKGELLASDHRP